MSNSAMGAKDLVTVGKVSSSHVHDWAEPNQHGAEVCKDCDAQKKE